MGEHIYKEHNKTLLLYHLVFPLKYRKKAITVRVGNTLREICIGISERYEIYFVEIGTDEEHVHFLVQSVLTMSVGNIVRVIKSITAKKIFERHPEVKEKLWGGNFWTSGYYTNIVGQYGNEEVIKKYVQNQCKNYKQIYYKHLTLF